MKYFPRTPGDFQVGNRRGGECQAGYRNRIFLFLTFPFFFLSFFSFFLHRSLNVINRIICSCWVTSSFKDGRDLCVIIIRFKILVKKLGKMESF